MKKTYNIAAIALAGLFSMGIAACNNDDDNGGGSGNKPVVDPGTISFTAGGGTRTITVTGDSDWTATAEEWIATDRSGNTLNITVGSTAVERSGEITFNNAFGSTVVTVGQSDVFTADDMAGKWRVSGYVAYRPDHTTDVIQPEERDLTISKIDDRTIEITDMLGLKIYYPTISTEDRFVATISNNTISIAAQLMEPDFSDDGWPNYLCRYAYGGAFLGFEQNWMLGFENFQISGDMTINLAEGGFIYDTLDNGEAARPTFIPLTKDPTGKDPVVYGFNWFYFNTVWTKVR